MLYSKTAKYAVLALAEVALCPPEHPVSTKQIAASASVPYPLLAKIVGQLRRAGLVHAARGKHGGILLTRPAKDITIQDVVLAMDGPDVLNDCPLFLTPCNCEKECDMHPLWKPARDAVVKFFENTTLQDIANGRQAIQKKSTA
ncbi:Rrf2 family transcriptional regulator [Candidatus Bipolaricaulota bacterium]|jgi:Rrf2 family protein|nr:Rrf2 family transcriptional regulator [Candidatus Bipolaricaulota bacterium]